MPGGKTPGPQQKQERRDRARDDKHKLAVRPGLGAENYQFLKVSCSCGRPVTMRRDQDREFMTMSDLMEIFRIHINELERGITQ